MYIGQHLPKKIEISLWYTTVKHQQPIFESINIFLIKKKNRNDSSS